MPRAALRLGTRASALARAQAEQVQRALAALHPGVRVELVFIRTSGDRGVGGPLPPVGAKGLFVKEIEEALLAGQIEVGVHSMKDLPAMLAAGLAIGAVPERAAAHDVLIGAPGGLARLAAAARVGTSSVRRRAQLLALRPDIEVAPLRGNVDTRLRRWRAGELDAIVLAAAGLARLGIDEPSARALPPEFVPAVGQGALALECRADDDETRRLLAPIEDHETARAVAAERAFQAAIQGDCNTPLAAYATVADDRVALRAMVCDVDGKQRLEESGSAQATDAESLGRQVAERLLARGARDILGR